MARSFTFSLVNKMAVKMGIFCFYIILDFFSEVTNNKYKFINTRFMKLVNIDA